MRLRTQLSLFCITMAGIILAMGALAIGGGSQIVKVFSGSLLDMEKLSQIRSLQVLLTRQKASLDAYFLVADSQELERFEELSRLVSARLKEMEKSWQDQSQIQSLAQEYDGVLRSAQSVIDLYRIDKKRAYQHATTDFLPKTSRFFDIVTQAEKQMSLDVQDAQQRMGKMVSLGVRVCGGLAVLGVVAGFFFAVSTLRSLSKSLRLLQEGVAAFGSGNWDHRIHLATRNELGFLARSFNEMAQNIKHLESQTVHMHRMSAVGQLAGGVAHEINNPLTGVLGQAQILLERLASNDPHRPHIEKIERAAVRCKRIVRSLLDFSRQKETQFNFLSLNEIVESTLELCEPDLQSSHVGVMKEFKTTPSIMGNGPQLQQVFLNLVTNAIQAMPHGGTLTVKVLSGSFIPFGSQDKQSMECVEVLFLDTGMGIEPQHIGRVFEPFFTTKEIGKGTGLGLSVSLGIVRNHGGDIRVESTGAGRGAVFRIFLPVSRAQVREGDGSSHAKDTPIATGKNPRY